MVEIREAGILSALECRWTNIFSLTNIWMRVKETCSWMHHKLIAVIRRTLQHYSQALQLDSLGRAWESHTLSRSKAFFSIYLYIYNSTVRLFRPWGLIYVGCKMVKMASLCVAVACNSNAHYGQLQTIKKYTTWSGRSNLSTRQGYRHRKNEWRQLIFFHVWEFHRTLTKVVYRVR